MPLVVLVTLTLPQQTVPVADQEVALVMTLPGTSVSDADMRTKDVENVCTLPDTQMNYVCSIYIEYIERKTHDNDSDTTNQMNFYISLTASLSQIETTDLNDYQYILEEHDMTVNKDGIHFEVPEMCVIGCTVVADAASSTASEISVRLTSSQKITQLTCTAYV